MEMHVLKLDMARDSSVGRERILLVPGSLALDGSAQQQQQPVQADINHQIMELKKEQEMQKQMLWHSFQEKNKQLELQHKLQLEHKYQIAVLSNGVFQELREQRIMAAAEEQHQRERRDREALRRKETNCSANASSEVKQKLQNFLIQKKQAQSSNGMNSSLPYAGKWGVVKSSSGESLPSGAATSSHPYKIPQPPSISKYDSDFPLRKTASEPNLLKIRLKQSVIERKARTGPLAARRQERLLQAAARRQQKLSNCTNTPDSGPNSPPALTNRGSPTSAPIQEENEDPQYHQNRGSINDLALFSSPSMPNISLGRPHLPNVHNSNHLALLATLRQQPQQPNQILRSPPQSFYPPLPPSTIEHQEHHQQQQQIHQELPPPQAHTTPIQIQHLSGLHHHMNHSVNPYAQPITDVQVAHARLYKQGHRPLGRTQSAPLPLGHPMLTPSSGVTVGLTHYENSEAERQAYEQQHLLLNQKIRHTVLTRSGIGRESELKEEESNEVIDLTDKKQPPKTVLTNSVITSTSQSIPDERLRDQEYLQQQREILMRHSLIQLDDPFARESLTRPLSRTLSSPLVHLGAQIQLNIPDTGQQCDNQPPVNLSMPYRASINGASHKITTGLAFDNLMLKHACMCGDNSAHPEHSGRLQSVWARLVETGLSGRCDRLRSRKATQEELQAIHSESHAMLFGTNQLNRQKLDTSRVSFVRLSCGGVGVDLDTTWNEFHTAAAARMAAGCVIDLAFKTAKGDIRNGFAVVRPPGHHAETELAMGFCFFNSVAIAAKLLKQRLPEVRKIFILDWDVHHGNGTQQAFYDDPDILLMSIHRHDDGNFFPGTGGPTECGTGPGIGFNVNVAWSGGLDPPLGDAEYLAAFRTIVMPIARDFAPDVILVSAGFDAAIGHAPPLGGYVVSPSCFGHLTRELMQLANGKVVLALEGGYDLPSICDAAQECVRALLGDEPAPISESELSRPPCQNAVETLQKTIAIQMPHWPCVKRLAHTVEFSAVRAIRNEREQSEAVTAMAGLSMQPPNRTKIPISRDDSEEPMEQDESK